MEEPANCKLDSKAHWLSLIGIIRARLEQNQDHRLLDPLKSCIHLIHHGHIDASTADFKSELQTY